MICVGRKGVYIGAIYCPWAVSRAPLLVQNSFPSQLNSMAADDKKAKVKQGNPEADAKNWEQRLKTEQEAPHKWNESWGSLFENGVPHNYSERIQHLEEEIKKLGNVKPLPKYGVSGTIREVGASDHRRKKMFYDPELDV